MVSLITRAYRRFTELFAELAKFGVVGATAAMAPTTPNLASSAISSAERWYAPAIRSAERWYAPVIRLAMRAGPLSHTANGRQWRQA